MRLFASVEGAASIRAQPRPFVTAFVRRIETGLLRGASPRRSRYVVTRHEGDGLAFRAVNWLTAINVGLNDVELAVSSDGVRYLIRYPRWARYVLLLSGGLGVVFLALLLVGDVRSYISGHSESRLPGLSVEQNVAIAWAMALFWGFVWPWILIALHKRPLRGLMARLIAEVDAAAIDA